MSGLRRTGLARTIATLLLATCATACATSSKQLPPIIWEGERIRFATTVGRLPCGDSLMFMDDRVDELIAELDSPTKPGEKITYYWLPGRMDLSPCPKRGDCQDGMAVFSRTLFHDHEIVHVLLRGLGRRQTFLYEGMAEAYGRAGGSLTVARGKAKSEVLRSLSKGVDPRTISYPLAGLFVRFLIETHGMAATKRVYARAGHDIGTDELEGAFQSELGITLDQALDRLVDKAPDCYPRMNLCTDKPVAWNDGVWKNRLGLGCRSPGVLEIVPGALRNEKVIEVSETETYRVKVSKPSIPVKDLVIASCGCPPQLHAIKAGTEATVELKVGRYRVLAGRLASDITVESEPVEVTIHPVSKMSD